MNIGKITCEKRQQVETKLQTFSMRGTTDLIWRQQSSVYVDLLLEKRSQQKGIGNEVRRQQEMQWSGKIIRISNLSSSLYSVIILIAITLKKN